MASILAAVFNVVVALLVPLGILGWLLLKKRRLAIPYMVGVLTFLVTQMVLRVPLLGLLGNQLWFVAFFTQHQVAYAVFLGLTAGIFEEVGRWGAIKLMRRHRGWDDAVCFGLGHGGLEAGLVGLNNLLLLALATGRLQLMDIGAGTVFAAGFERLFAMMLHVGFSVMVMRAVAGRKPLWLLAAILAHAVVDTGAALLQQAGLGIWGIELVLALLGLAALAFTLWPANRRALPALPAPPDISAPDAETGAEAPTKKEAEDETRT